MAGAGSLKIVQDLKDEIAFLDDLLRATCKRREVLCAAIAAIAAADSAHLALASSIEDVPMAAPRATAHLGMEF
jgi:hypothetical protein